MSFDMNPADEDPHHDCKREIQRLDAELEDAADKLSSCWLFLDALARSEIPEFGAPEQAAELLKRQGCPNWKNK